MNEEYHLEYCHEQQLSLQAIYHIPDIMRSTRTILYCILVYFLENGFSDIDNELSSVLNIKYLSELLNVKDVTIKKHLGRLEDKRYIALEGKLIFIINPVLVAHIRMLKMDRDYYG